jgi:hypothetical protein
MGHLRRSHVGDHAASACRPTELGALPFEGKGSARRNFEEKPRSCTAKKMKGEVVGVREANHVPASELAPSETPDLGVERRGIHA